MDFSAILFPLLSVVVPVFGGWIARKFLKTADDRARADIIVRIADDALALVLLQNPSAAVKELFDLLVAAMRAAAPTANPAVLERAAAGALARKGIKLVRVP